MTWAVTTGGLALLVISVNMPMAAVGLFFAGAGC